MSKSLRIWFNSDNDIIANNHAQERILPTMHTLHVTLTINRAVFWSAAVLWLLARLPRVTVSDLQVRHFGSVTEMTIDRGIDCDTASWTDQ
ncbi:hypothetical protein Cflav_PD1134 [Pedosphaera parvula Ellin514]|uniref:Uncharacterized protein n=1 Tax=Pedosphaera parvula (strain Ellin514) TaxID=320771 RepID=B9XQD5_PEDPL|nr:hypothetical protein Cflav_PD1134 [Pedosphaera parvula Ellin514]